jgi:iron complex outermembrane receptor protein
VREEGFSGGFETAFAPHLAGSFRLANSVKLRASGGYGFRIPTYTDLYYSDPTTVGNPNLKPESAWSGDGGADWAPGTRLTVSVTGFYSRQHDTIDYVRASPADLWHATNLSGLHFAGVESSATWIAGKSQTIRLAWTSLYGAQSALHGLESEYVFNYPVENAHLDWDSALGKGFTVRNRLQVAERYGQTAYPVWDVSIAREAGSGGWGRSVSGGVSIRLPE